MPLGTPTLRTRRPGGVLRLAATLLAGGAALAACGPEPAEFALTWDGAALPAVDPGDYHLPPPPLSDGVFPCTDCHDPEIPVNTQRRELKNAHQEIVLDHDEEHRWCLDCHDAGDRDQLHLASGELVAFEDSHRLCGQCHGDKHRDWRAGVHGRRTGRWDGEKQYMLCVHCHDSHRPAFQPLAPMPAPAPPRRTP
jgi:hypothetical protein